MSTPHKRTRWYLRYRKRVLRSIRYMARRRAEEDEDLYNDLVQEGELAVFLLARGHGLRHSRPRKVAIDAVRNAMVQHMEWVERFSPGSGEFQDGDGISIMRRPRRRDR